MPLRVVFMGTPEFSVPFLNQIIAHGHQVVAVYSQPPRSAGRGQHEKKSPIHTRAEALDIPVFTPASLKSAANQAQFAALDADVAVVVAYGLILPQAILDQPPLGCYNGHASLLPRWRGAAPIQRAIMAGDRESGIMVMKMDAGLDTGPVAMTERVKIDDDTTASQLHDQLSIMGAQLMVRALSALEKGELSLVPQTAQGITYAEKIDKAETRVDWSRPASEVLRHIHGLSLFPGAWCEMRPGNLPQNEWVRVKLIKAQLISGNQGQNPGNVLDDNLAICCGDGNAVRITRLQRAGKQAQDGAEFLRGNPVCTGESVN